MLNDEVASIISFCHKANPVYIYDSEIPEGFVVPSMYFPDPVIADGTFTSSCYVKEYDMYIKVFDTDTAKAFKAAEAICDLIRSRRYVVPKLKEDGTFTGRYIRIKSASTHMIESTIQDQGLVQIDISWDSRYNFVDGRYIDAHTYVPYEDGPKMQEIHFTLKEE